MVWICEKTGEREEERRANFGSIELSRSFGEIAGGLDIYTHIVCSKPTDSGKWMFAWIATMIWAWGGRRNEKIRDVLVSDVSNFPPEFSRWTRCDLAPSPTRRQRATLLQGESDTFDKKMTCVAFDLFLRGGGNRIANVKPLKTLILVSAHLHA